MFSIFNANESPEIFRNMFIYQKLRKKFSPLLEHGGERGVTRCRCEYTVGGSVAEEPDGTPWQAGCCDCTAH